MTADNARDRLANTGDQPWVLQNADWRIGSGLYFLELMMAVEIDFPTNLLKLLDKTSFDEMDRTLINT